MALFAGLVILAILYALALWIAYRATSERARSSAMTDAYTGVVAMEGFAARLEQSVAVSQRLGGVTALAVLGVQTPAEGVKGRLRDRRLMRDLAVRLSKELRDSDTLGRLGPREFGILLPTVRDTDGALAVVTKLRRAANAVMALNVLPPHSGIAFGLALSPEHGTEAQTLLGHAREALAAAVRSGSSVVLFESRHAATPRDLAGDLQRALRDGEFVLFYQPRTALNGHDHQAFEAFVRWVHPERGLLGPEDFLMAAERAGVSHELTLHVLEEAIEQLSQWRIRGLDISVAVNLSVPDLLDRELPVELATLLSKWEVEPAALELDVPEQAIAAAPARAAVVIKALSDLGVRVSVDHFGGGAMPLEYLERLPLGAVKIDRSYVSALPDNPASEEVVASTVSFAHRIGIPAIAQGVETEAVRARLLAMDCDYFQGFLSARPVPAQELSLN